MIKMSAAEIARIDGTTRANVNQTIKRGLKRIYKEIYLPMTKSKENPTGSPYDAFEFMTAFFNLNYEEDINEFFKTLPNDMKEEIKRDAKKRYM